MEDESTLKQTIAGAEDLNTHAVKPERNQQAGKPKDRICEQSIPVAVVEQAAEEVETLHGSIKAGTIAQIVVAFIAIIGLIYLLKLVLVTTLASILLAYVLEPAVVGLMRLRIPRQIGALITVSAALLLALGVAYFSYNRALDFMDELPRCSTGLRNTLGSIRSKADQLADQARSVVEPPKAHQKPVPVRIEQQQGLTDVISENSSTIADVLLATGFVPFLVYFMLASKDHVHVATVRLFPKEHRLVAHRTVGRICGIVFWYLGVHYFYFVGAISGFVTLIPYLGVFLALLPPLASGLDTLHKTGLIAIFITVIGMHAITMNLIYPKVIGPRLSLNPLAVSLSLLFWSWIWGAPGLILAIPILGALKIICDYVDPLQNVGSWLGNEVHR